MEMVWHLKPHEVPKAEMIINRLSEGGICLLSGTTEDLVSIPVDFNTNNMLPTNMVCLSKAVVDDIKFTYRYRVRCDEGIVITFNTPECLVEYNKQLLKALELPTPKQNNFIEVYEFLMSKHLKGIDKITFVDSDSAIEWIQLQRYWFSQVEKLKSKKLHIITSV